MMMAGERFIIIAGRFQDEPLFSGWAASRLLQMRCREGWAQDDMPRAARCADARHTR